MNNNEIQILGIQFLELGTIISDTLMGLVALIFFRKLKKHTKYKYNKFFSFFFLFFGISSLIAAWTHGLFLYFDIYLHIIAWILSGISFYFLQLASASLVINAKFKLKYLIFIKVQLLLYLIFLFLFPSFLIVKINFAIALLVSIIPVFFMDYLKNNQKYNLFVIFGILLAIIPGLFHKLDFKFAYIFNMNDLSHFVLIICTYFLYLGLKYRFFEQKELSKETKVVV